MAGKKRKFDPADLHPDFQKGYTQGQTAEEVAEEFDPHPSGVEQLRHMRDESVLPGTRVPIPRFVAEDDLSTVWSDGTGRLQRNVVATFQPETIRAMQAGHICLRCYEPHQDSFPLACSLCGYAMKELQTRDFVLEFEGGKKLGPSKPISEMLQERDLELEKRKFNRKLRDGGSPMKGLR